MVKKFFIYMLCLIICLVSMTGCSVNVNTDKTIEDKTNEEISYLEDEILVILNKYEKGEYVKDDGVDWDSINDSVIKINDVLDTVILDLSEIEISNEDLINFRNEVNNLSIAVTNKDENIMLQKISLLYSLLPTYLEKYSDNKNEIDIMKLKSIIVSSMIYANLLDWENAKNTAVSAENKYKEMMDDIDYMKEYSYNLNKVYILLEEFKTAIDLEELELSKLKYINFIEKI